MESTESKESIESTVKIETIDKIDNIEGIGIIDSIKSTGIKDMNDLDYKYSTRYIQSYWMTMRMAMSGLAFGLEVSWMSLRVLWTQGPGSPGQRHP